MNTPAFVMNFLSRIAVAALLSAVVLISGCGKMTPAGNTAPSDPPKVVVSTAQKRNDVITSRFFRGNVRASERVDIRARVQGYLVKVHFEDGADVRTGQLLFEIERQQHEARLAGAEAVLTGAKNKLREAEDRVERGRAAGSAISAEEMATRETQRDVALAAMQQAEASAADARINLSYTRIHSPIDGRIGRRLVDVGNLVGTDGNTLLTTVVKRQPVQIYFEVSGPVIDRVQRLKSEQQEEGKSEDVAIPVQAKISADEEYRHEGIIDYLDFEIDSTTGTAMVRGLFENKEDLLFPGTDADVRIPSLQPQTAVLIHDDAIGTNTQGRFVFLVGNAEIDGKNVENVVQTRQIERGELIDGMRVIEKGLEGGETYIVEGVQMARPGLPVTPVRGEGTKQTEAPVASEKAAE